MIVVFLDDMYNRLALKCDIYQDNVKKKDKSKAESLIELRKVGVDTTTNRCLKGELIDLCHQQDIPITTSSKNVRKGWNDAPKGML